MLVFGTLFSCQGARCCLRSGLRQAKSNLVALGLPCQIRSGGQIQSLGSNLTLSVRTLRALPVSNELREIDRWSVHRGWNLEAWNVGQVTGS